MAERRNALAEEDIYLGGSPIDDLRRTVNTRGYAPAQAAQNRNALAWEALSVIPGPGNAISAYDAYSGAGDTWNALSEGRYRDAGISGVLAALSGAGAVLGLPVGKAAKEAASTGRNALHIFAGPTARTADHNALATAQQLAKAGASRDEIWANTGWFQGVDGKWRFEIDDSGAFYRGSKAAGSSYADDVFQHPELYNAYPGLGTARVQETGSLSGPAEGAWHTPSGPGRPIMELSGPGKGSTAAHEMQHGVQGMENFAQGGLAETLFAKGVTSPQLEALEKGLSKLKRGTPEYNAALDAYTKAQWNEAIDQYRRLAGEVEARNVQTRLPMSAAERRTKAPWLTQDVPDDQQIVRMGAGGPQAMSANGDKLVDEIERTIRERMLADPDYVYGLRVTPDPLPVGSKAPLSRVWSDGEIVPDEYLSGTSTMGLSSAEDIKMALAKARLGDYLAKSKYGSGYYPGDNISLIRGWQYNHGEDPGEWVIQDGDVVAQWLKGGG